MDKEQVLFAFDEQSIPFVRNLSLTMNRPERHPANPVLPIGGPGMPDEFGVQFYGSVVQDQGKFKMWYIAVDPEMATADWFTAPYVLSCAYAESEDGIHWTRPDLGLVEYKGNRHNNLVAIEPAMVNMINVKVIVEPDDPDPMRRYKMTAHTWWTEDGERKVRGTICPLFSADGLTWHVATDAVPVNGMLKTEDRVLPPHHFEGCGGLYKWNGMYYATGQSGIPQRHAPYAYSGREVVMHRSPDFVQWSDTTSIGFLREGQRTSTFGYGQGEETHEGVSVWNRGNVLLGLYGIWHGGSDWSDRTIDLGLIMSNDGVHFREPIPEWAFLEIGPDGEWDQGGLIQGQGFFNIDDETWIYYGAWDPRCGPDNYLPRGGVGIATLPRDRFGFLAEATETSDWRPCDLPASLVTTTVSCDPTALKFNVEGVSNDGPLRVELLTETEKPIPGFSGKQAGIVAEAGFASPVRWPGKDATGTLPETVKLRVEFPAGCSAKLYAIYSDSGTNQKQPPQWIA